MDPRAAAIGGATTGSPVDTLRFLTCGSVDDGKSTLLGRLLHDRDLLTDDQRAALVRESKKYGTTGDDLDFALLVDGLDDEREQGITIDVAWRFFATGRRRFIVADCPGHEQYTRNMASGAANADLAVVLVDARAGIMRQTRRHSFIAALMGVRHVVLAVNKMDLVGFEAARFAGLVADYLAAVAELGFASVRAIPISARDGDNVVTPGPRMGWYDGPTLLQHLEAIDFAPEPLAESFRMPVQLVARPNADFRGYCGTIARGLVRRGDQIMVAGQDARTTVTRIIVRGKDAEVARQGDGVTLLIDQQRDISRGDVLCAPAAPVALTDRFEADLLWLSQTPLFVGRSYFFRLGTRLVPGAVAKLQHRIDVDSFAALPAERLGVNDVGRVAVALSAPVASERFVDCPDLGGFVVIDRQSNATVGVGVVRRIPAAAPAVVWHRMTVDKAARAALKGQKPAVLWFTGLSGAGKSTIADLVERKLYAAGFHGMILDGDNVRHGLNRDLGFSEADRVENIRRAAEAARLMTEAGLIVLVSFISPYRSDRAAARERFEPGEFLEVFVDTPIEECQRRDPKGLYARAAAGEIRNFTGLDAPYEAPLDPDVHLRTVDEDADSLAQMVIARLRADGFIS